MVEEAEILHNLHQFDARFIDVPEMDTPVTSNLHHISAVVEDFTMVASQPVRISVYDIKKQNSDEVIRVVESKNEKIQNLQIDQCNKEEEAVFDSEPFELDVQENGEISNNPLTISGGKQSSKTSLIFTKPYFRSVKSYLKDCNRMTEVCRICFCSLDDKEAIKLYEDASQDSTQIKNMLKIVLPDLDLEIYPHTVICTKCVELLLYSYQLKEKWLHTEEKLKKIIEKKKGLISSVADLVIIGKLLKDKNVQRFEDVFANDHAYTGEPNFQEGTRKNMTESILESLQSNEKIAPVSVFYGELDLNDKNRNRIRQKAYQASEQKTKNNLEKKNYGTGPFMCEQCGHMVTRFNSLKRHLISHTILREKKRVIRNKERKFMCEICGQLFLNLNNLRKHASKHAEYTCSFCNKVFHHQFRLQNHIKCKHVRNCYQCHLCGKQVSYARSLQVHMLLHYPKPKRQTCHVCDKKFHYPCNLKKHLHSHVREKLLRCEYCGRFLKHAISLRKHIQIYHMNQGKNVCEFCNKPYWKKCDLEKHKIRCHGDDSTIKSSNEQNVDELISKEEICANDVYCSVVYED